MSSAAHSWTGKSKGTPLGYRIFISTIRTFGVRAAYVLLYFVTPWYVLSSRASNAALNKYFKALRQWDPTIKGLSFLGSYMAFGRILVDRIAVRSGLADRFTWNKYGSEHAAAMIAAGKGGILLSAHMGNWELAGHLLHGLHGRISVVLLSAEDEKIKQAVDREMGGSTYDTIPLSNDLSHVFRMTRTLRDGQVLCMHGDRSLPGARVHRTSFLGLEAEFPMGPFALAAAHGVPVCISFVVRSGPMQYSFRTSEPVPAGSTIEQIFERYVQELERTVRAYPLQWFNYYNFWQHGSTARHR